MKKSKKLTRKDFCPGVLGDHAYYLEQAAATGDGSWLTQANDLLRTGVIIYRRGEYRQNG